MNSTHLSAGLVLVLASACASVPRPTPPPRVALRVSPSAAQSTAEAGEERGAFATAAHDLGNAPARLWSDTKAVFGDGINLLALVGAGGYALAQEQWEENEAEYFEDNTIYRQVTSDVLAALGNGLTLGVGLATWYFIAQGREDPTSYENSKTVLSALTVTGLATGIMKLTIPDGRPGGGTQDFPSGHASASMSVAASLDELYGHGIGIPAILLSGAIGLQRLDDQKHDSGAVVFGWVLGYVVGHTVAARSAPRVLGLQLGLYQDPDSGSFGLSLYGGL